MGKAKTYQNYYIKRSCPRFNGTHRKMAPAFVRKLLSPKWFEYMTYFQLFVSTVVGSSFRFDFLTKGLALVGTLDGKFRQYDDKTVPVYDKSRTQIGTFTFSGAFVWIHWNVFAVCPKLKLLP